VTDLDQAPVILRESDGVLIATLNRPHVRNAIDHQTAQAIADAMELLDGRSDLVVGVITGASPSFCTGMDLKAFLAGERPSIPGRGFAGLVERPPDKPLIAAVEGHAIAGGFEIALACDLIVASTEAMFGLPEVRRGLVAAGGGLIRLPARVPAGLAAEWALTGALVPAPRAAEVGLVNRLTEPGRALDAALELAAVIAANGPLAVRGTKQILVESPGWSAGEAFDRQRAISEPVRASEDAREGALAFTQKRPPRWSGR
jgi:enoyl-CoA hydratase